MTIGGMGEIVGLAERCEKAEGPDRELDKAIVLALKPEAMFQTDDGYDEPIVFHAEPVVRWKHVLPRFTASVDAALTLVPEGWIVANLCQGDSGKWWAELRHGYLTSYDKVALGKQLDPATPALAICAAALRARAPIERKG